MDFKEYWHFVDMASGFTLQLTIENVSLTFLESTTSFQEVKLSLFWYNRREEKEYMKVLYITG